MTKSVLATAIADQQPQIAAKGEIEIKLASGADQLMVTEGEFPSTSLDQLRFDTRTGSFRAIMRVPADDANGTLFRVSGRAFPVLEVPVLTSRISAGEKIAENDIQWVRVPATQVSQNIIDDANDLIGFTPKRSIRPGEMVRRGDIEPPRLVEKGDIVSVTYAFANMNLSSRARALEDGALGETIRVLNERSHRTIEVEITGMNEARIVPPRPVRLSALN